MNELKVESGNLNSNADATLNRCLIISEDCLSNLLKIKGKIPDADFDCLVKNAVEAGDRELQSCNELDQKPPTEKQKVGDIVEIEISARVNGILKIHKLSIFKTDSKFQVSELLRNAFSTKAALEVQERHAREIAETY